MNNETILLERMCAWFVYHGFEQNEDNLDNLSSLFVEWLMFRKIDSILDTDAKFYYERLDLNVFAHDVVNKNKMRKPGDMAKSMQSLIRELKSLIFPLLSNIAGLSFPLFPTLNNFIFIILY